MASTAHREISVPALSIIPFDHEEETIAVAMTRSMARPIACESGAGDDAHDMATGGAESMDKAAAPKSG